MNFIMKILKFIPFPIQADRTDVQRKTGGFLAGGVIGIVAGETAIVASVHRGHVI
jgi:hypothetical protein